MTKKTVEFKPILIDKQNRKILREGRNWGAGYAFAIRDGDKITTKYPLTACKDFLHEQVDSQHSHKNWSVYGLESEYIEGLFDEKNKVAHLVFGILPYSGGGKYGKQDEHTKLLKDNLFNIQNLINHFEKKFKIKQKTVFYNLDVANRYLAVIPLFWTQPYRISLLTWLIRVGIHYDGNNDIMEYLDNKILYSDEDRMFWPAIKPKLLQMVNGFIPEQKMGHNCPHEYGICGFKFTATDLYDDGKKKEGSIKITPIQKLQPMAF
jgi:hypothetical protein